MEPISLFALVSCTSPEPAESTASDEHAAVNARTAASVAGPTTPAVRPNRDGRRREREGREGPE